MITAPLPGDMGRLGGVGERGGDTLPTNPVETTTPRTVPLLPLPLEFRALKGVLGADREGWISSPALPLDTTGDDGADADAGGG